MRGPWASAGPQVLGRTIDSDEWPVSVETTRGKFQLFATLDAVAKFLVSISIPGFKVRMK